MIAPTLERAMRHPRGDHRATATNNQRPHRHPTCGRKGKERGLEKLSATALNRTTVQTFSVMAGAAADDLRRLSKAFFTDPIWETS